MSNGVGPGGRQSTTAVLAAVVALIALAVGLIVGTETTHRGLDSSSTPLVITVLGFIATTLTSLVALLKVDATRQDLRNGLIPAKVQEAVQTGVQDGSLTVKVDRTNVRTRADDSPTDTTHIIASLPDAQQEGRTDG